MLPRLSMLILTASILAGCGAQVIVAATTVKPGPITTILIVQKPSKVLGSGSQKDFLDGLTSALQTCRIQVTTHVLDDLSLDAGGSDEGQIDSIIASKHPDAVLSFAPTRSFIGGNLSSTRFVTRLIEIRSKKIVWQGAAVVKSGLAFGQSNSQVGTDLVHNMSSSGVLQTCPS